MDRITLRRRARRAMLALDTMGLALADLRAPVVSPAFLQDLCEASDKTVKGWLLALAELGLVKQVTTQKWRLTVAGCWMTDKNPELLRLSDEETRSESDFLRALGVEISETRNGSDFCTDQKPGVVPTYEVVNVGLRLKPGAIPTFSQKPGDSDFLLREEGRRIVNTDSLIPSSRPDEKPSGTQADDLAAEAERLTELLASRVRHARRKLIAPKILALLKTGTCAAQIELDILAGAAHANGADGKRLRFPAAVILTRITDGDHAGAHDIAAMPDGPDATRARRLADDLAGIEPEPDEAETPEADDLAAQLEALTLAETARAEGVTDESAAIWERALASIALEIPAATFEAWYRHTQLAERGGRWVVVAPSKHAAEWLAYRGAGCVRRTLRQVGAGGRDVEFVSDKE